MIRLIQLSDPHFGGVDAAAAAAALAYACEAKPTLVLVTGDLTLNGLPKEFEEGEALARQAAKALAIHPWQSRHPLLELAAASAYPVRAVPSLHRRRIWRGV